WAAALPVATPPGWLRRRGADVMFTRRHLAPWIGRRLTGRSSGDGRHGAHMDPATATAFWATPAEGTAPGPVQGWRRLDPADARRD
ncbi:SGNH/GDSL hydrolase family protein, partial [Streptomyces albidoflavus]